jgi:hypothetical protein
VFAVREGAVVVPEEALVPQGGKQYVFKVVDGPDGQPVAQRLEARIGLRLPGKVEILEGVKPGDLVVTAGHGRCCAARRVPVRVIDLSKPACRCRRRRPPGRRRRWQRPARRPARRRRKARCADPEAAGAPHALSETSIRRPVLATVMSLLLVLVGLVSFKQLSVREYPRIDEPLVTSARGCSAPRPRSSSRRSPSRWKTRSPASTASTS